MSSTLDEEKKLLDHGRQDFRIDAMLAQSDQNGERLAVQTGAQKIAHHVPNVKQLGLFKGNSNMRFPNGNAPFQTWTFHREV